MYGYVYVWWMPNRSEPINFTNYTDGQLTPNFTLYAVDDIFKFAAFSSSFSGYVIQFSSHLISSHCEPIAFMAFYLNALIFDDEQFSS